MTTRRVIELQQLTKRYGDTVVVDALSLTVERGELLVLLGGSGSGKTTTLKMINRLIEPSGGRVLIDGEDVAAVPPHELRRRIGYAFQQVGLFPHLTVGENVGITPTPARVGRTRESRRRVDELLDARRARSRRAIATAGPRELSGGQQQRVGVARALAAEPALMLLDEPFGALDPLTRDRLQKSFRRDPRAASALTVVFVTHDMVEALLLGDRIAVMHEGRLVQVGTPARAAASPGRRRTSRSSWARRSATCASAREPRRRRRRDPTSDAMRTQLALLPGYLTAHLAAHARSRCSLGTAVSVPLGIWVTPPSARPSASCSASRASSRRSRAWRSSPSWCRRSRRSARTRERFGRIGPEHRLPARAHRAHALQRPADSPEHRRPASAASTRRSSRRRAASA